MIEIRTDMTNVDIDVIISAYMLGWGVFPIDNGVCHFHGGEQ